MYTPEQGDGCAFTQSLRRFCRPFTVAVHQAPDLCVTEEYLDEKIQASAAQSVASEMDFSLNQYIFRELVKEGLVAKEMSWEVTAALVDTLIQRIIKTLDTNESAITAIYAGECLSETCRKGEHSSHSGFKIMYRFREAKVREIFKRAVHTEFFQKSYFYTLYRGGYDLSTDYPLEIRGGPDHVYSLSFGATLLSSMEADQGGAGAVPLEYMMKDSQGYSVRIDKTTYASHSLFVVPPVQRTLPFRIRGELLHPRSRVRESSPTASVGGVIGYSCLKCLPYLVTTTAFESEAHFAAAMRAYLTAYGQILVSR